MAVVKVFTADVARFVNKLTWMTVSNFVISWFMATMVVIQIVKQQDCGFLLAQFSVDFTYMRTVGASSPEQSIQHHVLKLIS